MIGRAAIARKGLVAGDAPDQLLRLTLLGAFSASVGDRQLRFNTRKARALLAYVALGEASGESRERLLGLLWSESNTKNAQTSLRSAVQEVNATLKNAGYAGFRAQKQTLSLDRQTFVTDVASVLAAVAAGHSHPLLLEKVRLADTLLSDLELVDATFQAWVRAKRHALHDRLAFGLERALPDTANSASAELAHALLNLDPTNEIACRHLIRARIARGQIGGALKAYKFLWDELAEEFDTEPSSETQDLIVQIKQQVGWSARPGETSVAELPIERVVLPESTQPKSLRKLVIAIAPFDVEGAPESLRPIINGFRHELTARLARYREWTVRSHGTHLVHTNETEEINYIVRASSYGGPEGLKLAATLESDRLDVIWSHHFALTAAELLGSQNEIIHQIARALNVNLSADRMRRMAGPLHPGEALHDVWLRGQYLINSASSDASEEAEKIFTRLIQEAPNFSPAYSSLVQIRNSKHIIHPGHFRIKEAHIATLPIARRATQLDPQDSRARLSMAWAYQLAGRCEDASLNASLAVDLNDNDYWTTMAAGLIRAYCGNHEVALQLCDRSMRFSATSSRAQFAYASAIHFLAGDYKACSDLAAAGLEASPAFRIWGCAADALIGHVETARADLHSIIESVRASWKSDEVPTDPVIIRWLLHIFPMTSSNDWERLRLGLATAGGDISMTKFGFW